MMKNFFRISIFTVILAVAATGCKEKPDDNGNEEEVVNGELVISNLPDRPGQAYDVEIYPSNVTIVTVGDWTDARVKELATASGSVSSENSSNVFSLWKQGSPQTKWEETGTFPVVLGKSEEGSFYVIKRAQITFTNGRADIDFSGMDNF